MRVRVAVRVGEAKNTTPSQRSKHAQHVAGKSVTNTNIITNIIIITIIVITIIIIITMASSTGSSNKQIHSRYTADTQRGEGRKR